MVASFNIGECDCCFGCVCWGVCNNDRTAIPKKKNCVPRRLTLTCTAYTPADNPLYDSCANACFTSYVGTSWDLVWYGSKSCVSCCSYSGQWYEGTTPAPLLPIPTVACDDGYGTSLYLNLFIQCVCAGCASPTCLTAGSGFPYPGLTINGGINFTPPCGGVSFTGIRDGVQQPAVCDADGFISQEIKLWGLTFLITAA